jgi:hypothetical protein
MLMNALFPAGLDIDQCGGELPSAARPGRREKI